MNKKMIIATVALVVVIAALLAVYFLVGPGKKVDSGATVGTDPAGSTIVGCSFTVEVVHGDGTERSFSYTTDADKLGAFLEAEGLIEAEGVDDGMFNTVDGEKADWNVNESWWNFQINGESAMVGIYDTTIEDGAVYKLIYTIGYGA